MKVIRGLNCLECFPVDIVLLRSVVQYGTIQLRSVVVAEYRRITCRSDDVITSRLGAVKSTVVA